MQRCSLASHPVSLLNLSLLAISRGEVGEAIGQTSVELAGLISFVSLVFMSKVDVPEWSLVGVRAGDVTVNLMTGLTSASVLSVNQKGEAGERGGMRRLIHEPVVNRLTFRL